MVVPLARRTQMRRAFFVALRRHRHRQLVILESVSLQKLAERTSDQIRSLGSKPERGRVNALNLVDRQERTDIYLANHDFSCHIKGW